MEKDCPVLDTRGVANQRINPEYKYFIDTAKNKNISSPIGVSIGNSGRLYVSDTQNNRVAVYSPSRACLFTIGEEGSSMGQLRYPTNAVEGYDNNIYVADFHNQRVQVFDKDGNYLDTYSEFEVLQIPKYRPVNLVDTKNGDIFVLDLVGHQVMLFNHQGRFTNSFGTKGNNVGQFSFPNGIAVDEEHKLIYIADTNNQRIQVFDFKGNFKYIFAPQVKMEAPKAVAYDESNQLLFVADALARKILIFNLDHNLIGEISSINSKTVGLGLPTGLAVDKKRYCYIADKEKSRILVFKY